MQYDDFYKNLLIQHVAVHEVFKKENSFKPVPDSWNVIVTDIKNSTATVVAGDHQLVNLAATGSIVACLNVARKNNIEIPFFFGGDGATILVPDTILEECIHALILHQENCLLNFQFFLRVDHCKVSTLYDLGHQLLMVKIKINDLHVIPVVIGDALQKAESLMKLKDRKLELEPLPFNLDLNGMECKWDRIAPPVKNNIIITLIVKAIDSQSQAQVYGQVLEIIQEIFGDVTSRHPITSEKLVMINKMSQLKNEVIMKFSKFKWFAFITTVIRSGIARWYLKKNSNGIKYLNELPLLSESLMLDGTINTVIAGTTPQKDELISRLERLRKEGLLQYGHHVSDRSVLSCYVTAMDDYHIHFLDGDYGGYTKAAQYFKI